MIKIKNKILPFGKFRAINLFGIIFYKGNLGENTLKHEAVHSRQWLEVALLLLPLAVFCWWVLLALPFAFYVWYFLEWVLRGFKYEKISFERDAYFWERREGRAPFYWIYLYFETRRK